MSASSSWSRQWSGRYCWRRRPHRFPSVSLPLCSVLKSESCGGGTGPGEPQTRKDAEGDSQADIENQGGDQNAGGGRDGSGGDDGGGGGDQNAGGGPGGGPGGGSGGDEQNTGGGREGGGDDGDDGGLLSDLGDAVEEVGGFFKGAGEQAVDAGKGLWDGVTTLACTAHICSHDAFKETWGGYKKLATDPVDSLKAIWNSSTKDIRDDWNNGNKGEAIGRGTVTVLSLIFGGKGISKLKNLPDGKKVPDVTPADKLAELVKGARGAADKAANAARRGDVVAAKKYANKAERKADRARKQAKEAGCKVGAFSPSPRLAVPSGSGVLAASRVGQARAEPLLAALLPLKTGKKSVCRQREKAQKAADRARQQVHRADVNKRINLALQGKDANGKEIQDKKQGRDTITEGEVAKAIRANVVNFNKKYGPNGRDGEIDVETKKTIIEVTTAKTGKKSQLLDHRDNKQKNPKGKPVILFAKNGYNKAAREELEAEGIRVVDSADELKKAMRRHGEHVE